MKLYDKDRFALLKIADQVPDDVDGEAVRKWIRKFAQAENDVPEWEVQRNVPEPTQNVQNLRRYQAGKFFLYEIPRQVPIQSQGRDCWIGNHPMSEGDDLWVAEGERRTGNRAGQQVDVWMCGLCATKIINGLE